MCLMIKMCRLLTIVVGYEQQYLWYKTKKQLIFFRV